MPHEELPVADRHMKFQTSKSNPGSLEIRGFAYISAEPEIRFSRYNLLHFRVKRPLEALNGFNVSLFQIQVIKQTLLVNNVLSSLCTLIVI